MGPCDTNRDDEFDSGEGDADVVDCGVILVVLVFRDFVDDLEGDESM